MFDFALPVVVAGSFGILYLWLVAPRLLPARQPLLSDTSPRVFDALLHINEDSYANGQPLSKVLEKTERRMKVESIRRGEVLTVAKLPTTELREGDRLLVRDTPENLKEYEQALGATLYNVTDIEHPIDEEHPLSSEGQQLAEVVVTQGSLLHRHTLKQLRFAERYNLVILAINRAQGGQALKGDLAEVRLESGDVLLLQGSDERIAELRKSGNLLVFSAGGYKFSDFLRVGIPLTLIMWVGLLTMLMVTYNL